MELLAFTVALLTAAVVGSVLTQPEPRKVKIIHEPVYRHPKKHGSTLRNTAYEVARQVPQSEVYRNLKQVREGGVPHRCDSWLLAKARKKLGRPLREAEKARIRKLFREAFLRRVS